MSWASWRLGDALPTRDGSCRPAYNTQQRRLWMGTHPLPGVVALWLLASVVRRPTSLPHLFVEALGTTLAVIGVIQVAGIALWLLEQRW